jgi:hypothetical protein
MSAVFVVNEQMPMTRMKLNTPLWQQILILSAMAAQILVSLFVGWKYLL